MGAQSEFELRRALAFERDPQRRQFLRISLYEERLNDIHASFAGYLLIWKLRHPFLLPMLPVSSQVMNSLKRPHIQFMAQEEVLYVVSGQIGLFLSPKEAVILEGVALLVFVQAEYQARLAMTLVQTLIQAGSHPSQLRSTVTHALRTFLP